MLNIYFEVFADRNYANKTTDRRFVSGRVNGCGGCHYSRNRERGTLYNIPIELYCRRVSEDVLCCLRTENVALGVAVKEPLFSRQVRRSMLPGKELPRLPVLSNSGKIQCRTQFQNTSMFVILV